MNKNVFLVIFGVFFNQIGAQETERVFYLGHSLINFEIPNMVQRMSEASNLKMHSQRNIGNGANLLWHWTQPHTGQGNRWDTTLRNQLFDKFILTEAIALKSHLKWSNTYSYLDSFYNYASSKSPDIKLYVYETWHCINSGTQIKCMYDDDTHIPWKDRLSLDLPLWEGIADHLNKRKPKTAFLIPGGQGILNLHNAIEAGLVSGFTSSRQLFSDDIHLTNIGNYFIACIMYAVIHKKSPEGLPNRLNTEWGIPYEVYPTVTQAEILQKIAWETVCKYEKDDVVCLSLNAIHNDQPMVKIIPSRNEIYIISQHNYPLDCSLVDISGKALITWKLNPMRGQKFENINSGYYFLTTSIGTTYKIVIH